MITVSYKRIYGLLVCCLLGGCVFNDLSDLDQYTDEVLKRKGGRIEPLPEIVPYVVYEYKSGDAGGRDPFELFYEEIEKKSDGLGTAGLTEEMKREIKIRNREELEQFALDSLRMVGSWEDKDGVWGLIKDPDGLVHRIKVGNYIGLNIGKILNIYEDKIELREIFQNAQGRWEERQASLALITQE